MPRRGRTLEKLIERIERLVSVDSPLKVESPIFLTDKLNGDSREFDVGLKLNQNHHDFVTVIEAKDWKRKVDTPIVEGFARKCQDCLVNQGIIVSSLGFSKPALTKAQNLGIKCFMLEEMQNLDWCGFSVFENYRIEDLKTNFQILFGDPAILKKKNPKQDVFFKGEVFDGRLRDIVARSFLERYRRSLISEGARKIQIQVSNPHDFIVIFDGNVVQAVKVIVEQTLNVIKETTPAEFHRYKDLSQDDVICEAVTTSFGSEGSNFELSFIKQEGTDNIKVVLEKK